MAGVQTGAGLPPVLAKLAEQITRWEFVDMVTVLWPLPKVSEGTGNRPKRQAQDINIWLQCFATFTTVMA